MTTVKEIAKESGYSSTTVSRLLNNDPKLSISASTKNKILEVANKLGYWKKHINKQIHPTIALLYQANNLEQLQDEYFTALRKNILQIFKERGLKTKIYHNIRDLIKEARSFQGFLGVGSTRVQTNELKDLAAVLPKGVFIDTNPAPKLFDSIRPNLTLTIQDAMNRLIKDGYQHICFITAKGTKLNQIQEKDSRQIAFENYVQAHQVKNANLLVTKAFSVHDGYQMGKLVLKKFKSHFPNAFLIASDTLAIGILQAFNEAKISIPGDTSILSINNNKVDDYVSPPLSSYNIKQKQMINMALKLLIDLITDYDRPRVQILMNTNLVLRKSYVPKNR